MNWRRFFRPDRAAGWIRQVSLDASRVVGPIFQIESLLAVRRARYFLLRAVFASLLLFTLWINYEGSHRGGVATTSVRAASQFGAAFFIGFASVQLIVAMVVTAAVTAGTIAQERQRRTIEYLFATDLSNSEIVLGKLASRLLLVWVFLLVGLPVLSLALLFGGIDIGDLLQLFVVTASTVIVIGSLSILLSGNARRPREAVMRAFIVALGVLVLPWLSLYMAFLRPTWYAWIAPVNGQLLIGNPFVFLMVLAGGRMPVPAAPAPGWPGVWELVRNHAIASLLLVALAVWRVRRVYLREAARPARANRDTPGWRFWRPQLGAHPMIWKELFAERAVSGMGIIGRIIVILLFGAILVPICRQFYLAVWGRYRPDDFQEMVTVIATIIGSLFLVVLAARAATTITNEKEKQCWDTLISTPISGAAIVVGKTLGNFFALRWVLMLFGTIWAMAVYLRPRAIGPAVLMTVTLALLSLFFASVGTFFSLRCRSSTRSMCWSMIVSLFVGGGYLMFYEPITWALHAARIVHPQDQREMILAGSAPYLVARAGKDHSRRYSDELGTGAFVAGVAGYFLIGALLFLDNVRAFDCLAGRPHRSRNRNRTVPDSEPARVVGFRAESQLRYSGDATE